MSMWQPKQDLAHTQAPQQRTSGGVMAHRRTVGGRSVLLAVVSVVVFGFLLAGSVYVSNRVTDLRTGISRLEDRRGFLEAGTAGLLTKWNKAIAPAVITSRAQRELGLIVPDEPGLVLVELANEAEQTSAWRRLLENMGGGDPVQAAEFSPRMVMGSMVSLTPRDSVLQGGD